jgi:hypothetical protein
VEKVLSYAAAADTLFSIRHMHKEPIFGFNDF